MSMPSIAIMRSTASSRLSVRTQAPRCIVRESIPERVEAAERLAHGTAAHAERAGQVRLDEALARYVTPREDAGSDVVDDAVSG